MKRMIKGLALFTAILVAYIAMFQPVEKFTFILGGFKVNASKYDSRESFYKSSMAMMSNLSRQHESSRSSNLPNYIVAKGHGNVMRSLKVKEKLGVQTPVILKWSTRRHKNEEEILFGANCGGCHVTMDRRKLNTSIAVVFFIQRKKEKLPEPKNRRHEQVYVFWSVETPSKLLPCKKVLQEPEVDQIFNLTMNFRRDSDIIQYSGNRELSLRFSKNLEKDGSLEKILRHKTKQAVWFVSNCFQLPGAIARMHYAFQLVKAGLKLDKFGDCFPNGFKTGNVKVQVHDYKFYLAFENSIHCPSYVSEKFWRNALDGTAVPIVFGPTRNDVEAVAPEHSFIHTDDFDTPSEMVDYLEYLDSNDTAYLEYHKWRYDPIDTKLSDIDIGKETSATFCRLCQRQVLENRPPKTIASISKWMFESNYVDDQCLVPKYKLSEGQKRHLGQFFKISNSYDDDV